MNEEGKESPSGSIRGVTHAATRGQGVSFAGPSLCECGHSKVRVKVVKRNQREETYSSKNTCVCVCMSVCETVNNDGWHESTPNVKLKNLVQPLEVGCRVLADGSK